MTNIKRRQFTKLLGSSIAIVPLAGLLASRSQAAEAPMVDPESATAKTLQYAVETPEVGKNCVGCALYVVQEGKDYGACAVFPGSFVPANAWCSAYVAKPS